MTAALHWLDTAARVLCCEWVDRRGVNGWCETHDDPWPCGRAQEAADVLAEELDQPKEQKMGNDTPTPIDPADIRPGDVVQRRRLYVVKGRGPDHGIDARCHDTNTHEILNPAVGTWHLVSRPDPDAEAVEAIRHAIPLVTDGYAKSSDGRGANALLAALRHAGWDVVRRAES